MTLVELLLSVAIAVVAASLAFSLFRTVSRTLEGQAAREQGGRAARGALDRLRDDLSGAFAPEGVSECGFSLSPREDDTNQTAELSLCILAPPPPEEDARWSRALRVRYRADPAAGGGPARLLRTEEALSGPGAMQPPATNVAAEGLRLFAVELWDGGSWRSSWSADSEKVPPRAARIRLASAQGGREAADEPLEIYIPAGMVITSSFERAGASAPASPGTP
jgi:type II secretory pathway pseudopilin PulG